MDDGVTLKVRGLDELKAVLRGMPDRLRKRALRNALAAGGRVFRDEARRLTPALEKPIHMANGMMRRAPGTVRKAITVRTSKIARRRGDVGVFVNVRPAKGAMRGANKPFDPFYWRFLEFGTKHMPKVGMLAEAAKKAEDALRRVEVTLKPSIQRLARRQQP